MLKYLIPLMLLVSAPLAFAGELTAGEEVIANCWKDAADHAAATDCIVQANVKIKQQLADQYERLMTQTKQSQTELRETGNHEYEDLAPATEASEKAFQDYVEKECGRIAAQYGSGNGAGEGQLACEIDLIDQRMKTLDKSMTVHDQ